MNRYCCLILYMFLIHSVVLAQEKNCGETVSFKGFEYSQEEYYKLIGGSETNESPGPLITGVDALKLFTSVVSGYKEDPNVRRDIGPYAYCVGYLLRKEVQNRKKALPASFSLGVFENREKAIIAFAREIRMVSAPLSPLSCLGDRAYYGASPNNDSTTIRFRRKNVVVILGIDLPSDAAINIAKKMDHELEHNTTFVTRGDRIALPQIEIKNLPETIGLNKIVECELELKDIDPNEAIIYSDSAGVVVVRKDKGPKIVYYSPKSEKEIGLKTLRIYVANQKNVVTHREYKIKVTAN